MQRVISVLSGAAVALALVAGSAPAQAASLQPAPAVLTDDGPTAGIQKVEDRRWRHRHGGHHRFRDRDGFRLGFGLGFGAPFWGGGYPYAYSYRPYRYAAPVCPYGTWYDPGYGCVAAAYPPVYRTYPYGGGYGGGPGINLEYRERGY
jgi:hypothetical protein